jgi:hypothetical protein
MQVLRILGLLAALTFFVPASQVQAATPCGGTVTHTATQSELWGPASWNATLDDAEWSGYIKYNAPAGQACQILVQFSIAAPSPVTFRQSTSDPSRAQWNPTDCYFPHYASGDLGAVFCEATVPAGTQRSYRVKLVAPESANVTSQFVFASVYDKDSAGNWVRINNPGGVSGWTFN